MTDWKSCLANPRGRFTREWFENHVATKELLKSGPFSGYVLDVGCGIGGRTYCVAKSYPAAIVYGLDVSPAGIVHALSHFNLPNTRYDVGDALQIIYDDEKFDSAFTMGVIEHIPDTAQFLAEIRRVLKPGGRLFISVTEKNYHSDSEHVHSFTLETAKAVVESASFSVTECYVEENIIFLQAKKDEINDDREIINKFQILYGGHSRRRAYWLGVMVWKYPQDAWIFQEIIFETRPDVIIECGTGLGGSALFLASICDLIGNGQILTIDRKPMEGRPKHERIRCLSGSTTASVIVEEVRGLIDDRETVMVILDSNHHKAHVLHEMLIYGQFVTSGSYMIVEDTAINGHPTLPGWGPGPWEAVEEFLSREKTFVIDRSREKFLVSANPSGYLRKI